MNTRYYNMCLHYIFSPVRDRITDIAEGVGKTKEEIRETIQH